MARGRQRSQTTSAIESKPCSTLVPQVISRPNRPNPHGSIDERRTEPVSTRSPTKRPSPEFRHELAHGMSCVDGCANRLRGAMAHAAVLADPHPLSHRMGGAESVHYV